MSWELQAELDALTAAHLRRQLRVLESDAGLLNFASNDYLGLARHAVVMAAFTEGIARYGTGSGASRLVTGTHAVHQALEEAIAAFKKTESALLFGSGYTAALGAITSLMGSEDCIILDKLCHASLIDAAKLSGATIRVFPHNHLDRLESLLKRCTTTSRRVLIVTESVFSMDGDTAPLTELVDLKERYGAWLMVDEAHAIGVVGPRGRGLAAALGLSDRIELQLGTLSKALGLMGGYIAARREVRDVLVNRARSFIYTTAPPPALAHAGIAALELTASAEGETLRSTLHQHVQTLRSATRTRMGAPVTAIHPHIVGDEAAAVALAERMAALGFITPAIRYPTVARGRARLRITLSAAHHREAVEKMSSALVATSA
jgi:8-amino-7-oxononanoate synthase